MKVYLRIKNKGWQFDPTSGQNKYKPYWIKKFKKRGYKVDEDFQKKIINWSKEAREIFPQLLNSDFYQLKMEHQLKLQIGNHMMMQWKVI